MTRKQFVQQAAERGMITAGKAAILTGRKPSGKFAAELGKRWIWSETFTDGTKVYSKAHIMEQFIPRVKPGAIRPDSEAYVESVLKDKQVPLRLEAKPKKSEAELLDGVHYSMYGLKRNLDGGREFVHLSVNNAVLWAFDPYAIAQLAREIVRRIDDETVKRSEVQAQIDAALLAYKERIKGAL